MLGIIAYFVALTALLGLSGFTGQKIDLLAVPEFSSTEERNISAVRCLADVRGFIPVIGTFHTIKCAVQNFADVLPVIGPALAFTTNLVGFFFQVASYQTELHPFATTVLVAPPGVVLAYIGLRLARGGG